MEISNITQFITTYAIVGVLLSAVLEFISRKFDAGGSKMKFISVFFSLAVAGFFVWVKSTPWFPTFLTILSSASAVYALFFNNKKAE